MALTNHDIRIVQGTEYDADDVLGVQFDVYGKNGGCPAVEMHHNFGFQARAADPDTDGRGCQVHTAYEGDRQHCWLSYDPRPIAKLPPIKKGESRMYGFAGNFVRCHLDGSISTYTTTGGGDPEAESVYSQVAPDKFVRTAPWGTERFDDGGWRLTTHTGARIGLGGVGGLPSPLDQLGTYFAVRANIVKMECASASFGGSGAVPLAKADAVVLLAEAIITAFGTITAGSSTTGGAPAATSLQGAMAAIKAALPSIVSGA